MGCLIYYVLSRGSHPFGPPLKRQINIEAGDYSLNDLLGQERYTTEHLVHAMISFNYNFRSVVGQNMTYIIIQYVLCRHISTCTLHVNSQ